MTVTEVQGKVKSFNCFSPEKESYQNWDKLAQNTISVSRYRSPDNYIPLRQKNKESIWDLNSINESKLNLKIKFNY